MGYLPKDNGMRKGVVNLLIDIIRTGQLEVTQRDTYHCVYHENGTYIMPVIPDI
jgi:hypothetical protein